MSVLALFANLRTGKLTDSTGGDASLPDMVLGDTRRFTLRTLDVNDAGELIERDLRIRTLTATVGKVIAPPKTGEFSLKIEGVEVGPFTPDTTIEEFAQGITGTQAVAKSELGAPACWLVSFTNQTALAVIEGAVNSLDPESLVRIRRKIRSGRLWYEVRLIQAPLAWNVDGHTRVLAPPPSVDRVITGAEASADAEEINELQRIFYPPAFRGTYFLKWDLKQTRLMGMQDGPSDIADALNAMFADKAERFRVTNAEANYEYVEFVNALGGAPQPKIEVQVNSFQPGILTFDLPFDRENLDEALRDPRDEDGKLLDFIEAPLEIEAEILEADQDMEDLTVPGRIITLCQQPLKVVREQKWNELTAVKVVNFLKPGNPRDYVEVTADQILFATPGFKQALGNGELKEFTLNHPLNTRDGIAVAFENNAQRRALRFGTEYTFSCPSDGAVALTFTEAPAVNGVVIVFIALGPGGFFQAHTHTIGQIVGLSELLAALAARVAALETYIPDAAPTRELPDPSTIEIALPKRTFLVPDKNGGEAPSLDGDGKSTTVWKAAKLLPAIHDATIDAFAALPLPPVLDAKGKVFRNDTGNDLPLSIRVSKAKPIVAKADGDTPGGYFGSDGRQLYRLTRRGETNSFFATDLESLLWQTFVKERELRVKWRLLADCKLAIRTLVANTPMQARLVVEFGTATSEGAPAPTALNLRDVVWNAVPLLDEQLIIMDTPREVKYGFQLWRRDVAAFDATGILYESSIVAGATPTSANLALRARLIDLDPVDPVPRPTGLIHVVSTGSITIEKP